MRAGDAGCAGRAVIGQQAGARIVWLLRARVLLCPLGTDISGTGDYEVSRARRIPPAPPTDAPPCAPMLAEVGMWRVADGVLFSVLSSLVLWSIIITSLYQALT